MELTDNILPRDIAYDHEMELPGSRDPRMQDALREFAGRDRAKPTEQNVEALMCIHEKNMKDENTKAQRWEGQQRWQGRENEEMRMVRIMHPDNFIWHLRRVGIKADYDAPLIDADRERGEEPFRAYDNPRIWLNGWTRAGRIGVNAWIPDAALGRMAARTITTLQFPYGPEFTLMRFNEYDVPTNERYRGWRTALLVLITSNVLTEEEAHKAFGPAMGQASMFYREQLFYHRSIRMGIESEAE